VSDILKRFKNIRIRKKKKSLKIGVISGGISSERKISLMTGKNIYQSLLKSGYNAIFIDMKDDFYQKLKEINLAFMAIHGRYGEDGTAQGLLELMKIPYTGSGVLSSAMAINKILSKKILIYENIPTPEYIAVNFTGDQDLKKLSSIIEKNFGYPIVVKPNSEGSTIGVNIVRKNSQLKHAIKDVLKYDSKILIEEYIRGRELTVSIIGIEPVALPIIEIKPKSGFYDYKSKYTKDMTEYIVPADLDKKIVKTVSEAALKCHRVLECCGISRVDFILDDYGNSFVFEVNTMPGMTATSLVPKAAKAVGIDFDLLVEIILDSASLKL
jgi:D-alanine-D-alanine ligase